MPLLVLLALLCAVRLCASVCCLTSIVCFLCICCFLFLTTRIESLLSLLLFSLNMHGKDLSEVMRERSRQVEMSQGVVVEGRGVVNESGSRPKLRKRRNEGLQVGEGVHEGAGKDGEKERELEGGDWAQSDRAPVTYQVLTFHHFEGAGNEGLSSSTAQEGVLSADAEAEGVPTEFEKVQEGGKYAAVLKVLAVCVLARKTMHTRARTKTFKHTQIYMQARAHTQALARTRTRTHTHAKCTRKS